MIIKTLCVHYLAEPRASFLTTLLLLAHKEKISLPDIELLVLTQGLFALKSILDKEGKT